MSMKRLLKRMRRGNFIVLIPDGSGTVQLISPKIMDEDKVTEMLQSILEERKGS